MCHPRCVCETRRRYVVKQLNHWGVFNDCHGNNYMFRPVLAIIRQPDDGQHRPKHVVVSITVIKYTSVIKLCLTTYLLLTQNSIISTWYCHSDKSFGLVVNQRGLEGNKTTGNILPRLLSAVVPIFHRNPCVTSHKLIQWYRKALGWPPLPEVVILQMCPYLKSVSFEMDHN